MNITCINLLLFLSFVWCDSANAQKKILTAKQRYVLTTKPNPVKNMEEYTIVSLEDKQTGQLLWKREIYYPNIVWSQDHKSVAIDGGEGLFVWQVGEKLRHFGVPAGRDYTMGSLWSPDGRHLLVRCGSSGMADTGYATVFCLKLGRGQTYKYYPMDSFVSEMKWKDNKAVVYSVFDYDKMQWDKKPRVWRVP